MHKEGPLVFRGQAREGSAGVCVVAIGNLHLVGDEGRRARACTDQELQPRVTLLKGRSWR